MGQAGAAVVSGEKYQYRRILAGQISANLRYGGLLVQAEKMENCCQLFSAMICEHCGSPFVRAVTSHCHVRLCPFCEELRSLGNRKVLRYLMKETELGSKFLTLTVKNRPEITPEWISEIWKSVRLFRQRKNWKEHVLGGVQSLEIIHHETTGYHPHVHFVLDSRYWNAFEISSTWEDITKGDGKIINIKEIHGDRVDEFCKYIAKASDYSDQWRVTTELFKAIRGKQLFSAFGAWYGLQKEIKKEIEEERQRQVCPDCGSELTFAGQVGTEDVYQCPETGDFFLCPEKAQETIMEHASRLARIAKARGF